MRPNCNCHHAQFIPILIRKNFYQIEIFVGVCTINGLEKECWRIRGHVDWSVYLWAVLERQEYAMHTILTFN
jgi:hypothetical protein